MLSKADRRSRHLATAHHFEAEDDDEIAGVVAAHYLEAFRATRQGPDADALAARARDWLGQAAERATSLGSPEQALVFAEQALEITPKGRERAELLKQAARAAGDALRHDEQVAYLRQAVETFRALDDRNAEVTAGGILAEALADADRVDELRAVVEEMHARLGDGGDDIARAELHHSIALAQYYDEELEECLRSIDRALAGFERARAWDRFSRAINEKAVLLAGLGRLRESTALRRGLLALAADANDLRLMAAVQMNLGTDAPESTDQLELSLEAAATARRGGYRQTEMGALANAIEAAVEAGAWGTADELLDNLMERPDLSPRLVDAITLDGALLAAYRGDRAAAQTALDGLSLETKDSADPTMRAWYRRVRSVLALMSGDLDDAYEEGMTAIDTDPGGPNSAFAVWCTGRAALWMGDPARASVALGRMPGYEGAWQSAVRRALGAGIAALEGQPREAAIEYDSVLAGRLAKGDRFTHALATLDAVAVLPEDLVPEGAVEATRTYLEELGAGPLLARLTPADVPAVSEG
jgi:tetratricopeptide (TPR) repeat protein